MGPEVKGELQLKGAISDLHLIFFLYLRKPGNNQTHHTGAGEAHSYKDFLSSAVYAPHSAFGGDKEISTLVFVDCLL